MHHFTAVSLDRAGERVQMGPQRAVGVIFVLTGETTVAGNVRVEDSGQLALETLAVHLLWHDMRVSG